MHTSYPHRLQGRRWVRNFGDFVGFVGDIGNGIVGATEDIADWGEGAIDWIDDNIIDPESDFIFDAGDYLINDFDDDLKASITILWMA